MCQDYSHAWAEVEGDLVRNVEENSHGINTYFPHGLTCTYNSHKIPMYVTCSESGSITSKILADIMCYLDQSAGFDRTDATPFLLLDGHGSQFGFAIFGIHQWHLTQVNNCNWSSIWDKSVAGR